MALIWDWNKKIGRLLVIEDRKSGPLEFEISIYRGNAMMIFLFEYEVDGVQKDQMYNFFVDKQHAKNCLKNAPKIFRDWKRLELWDFTKQDIWFIGELASKYNVECEIRTNEVNQYEFH